MPGQTNIPISPSWRCFICSECWAQLLQWSMLISVLAEKCVESSHPGVFYYMHLFLSFLTVLTSWRLVGLKQQQRSSFKPVTCLWLISRRLLHPLTLSLPPHLTIQERSWPKTSGNIYPCAPHILCVFYRPGVGCSAHPARQSWQCIGERKRWLSDLWRSCSHLIILLKEHMDFLFLMENKHTPLEYPMKFWTHTRSRDHVPRVLAHGNFL